MANAAITVDLNAKIAQFETELKKATSSLDKFGQHGNAIAAGLKGAFAGMAAGLSVGALAAFAKSGIDAADALNDMSQRLGVSVKDLASFKLAAEQSGTSLDGVGNGIARLSRSIGDAEGGNKKLAAALSALGVTARDPKEAFFQLADAVQRIDDPAKRATLLNQVLGKSYQELVPLLAQGGDELRKSAEASESFADAMARLAPNADKFNDSLAELKQNAAAAAAQGLAPLVEQLNVLIERIGVLHGLRGAGATVLEIVTGSVSADTKNSLDRVNKDIAGIEATITRLGKNSGGRDQSIPTLVANLERLKKVRAELQEQAARQIQKPPETETLRLIKENRGTSASGGSIDLSSATQKTGKPLDKNALFTEETERISKQVAKEVERIAADFAFMRDVDLAQNNPIAEMAQEWVDAGAALHDSLKTPLESLEERLAYIDELMRRNVISVEDYGRAYADALDEGNTKAEKTKSLAEEIGLTFTSAFEEAIVAGGKFSDVLKGIADDILKLLARKMVTEPLMNAIGSFIPSANGNVFSGPGISAYSGSVVSSPTLFPFANGIGLRGESGPEAVLPLKRGPGGKLGVSGGGVAVEINNYSGQPASARESVDSRGNRRIEVTIGEAVAGEMRRAGSSVNSAVRGTFGASPALVGR